MSTKTVVLAIFNVSDEALEKARTVEAESEI
jgi:hypothetical protein